MSKKVGRNDPCPCGSGKKYKRCCMESHQKLKDCFGDQGGTMLSGESPQDCVTCELFDRCHKVTIAATLQSINVDLSLLTQNGLEAGWLKCFKDLSQDD